MKAAKPIQIKAFVPRAFEYPPSVTCWVKRKYGEDMIALVRFGDFYLATDTDAETVASITGAALGKIKDEVQTPTASIPYFAFQDYVDKLVNAGYRVAVCDPVK